MKRVEITAPYYGRDEQIWKRGQHVAFNDALADKLARYGIVKIIEVIPETTEVPEPAPAAEPEPATESATEPAAEPETVTRRVGRPRKAE